ncbi:hypothetical protein ACFUMI_38675, partial [Streptomyces sp. NPDC057273]|uniref:hypothetical protein n=1 Tax=Streptomyces sp. NPDC057273 TaxID=3346080 RepID=UPI00362DBF41
MLEFVDRAVYVVEAAEVAGSGGGVEEVAGLLWVVSVRERAGVELLGLGDGFVQAPPELGGQHALLVRGPDQDRVQGIAGAGSGIAGEDLLGCRGRLITGTCAGVVE